MFAAWTPDAAFLIDPEIRDATCPLHLLQGLAWAVVIVGLNEEGFPGCAARSGEVPERKVGAFRSWIFRPPWSRPLGSTIHQPSPSSAEATRPPGPGVRDPLRPFSSPKGTSDRSSLVAASRFRVGLRLFVSLNILLFLLQKLVELILFLLAT